jgi:hypothetical protein
MAPESKSDRLDDLLTATRDYRQDLAIQIEQRADALSGEVESLREAAAVLTGKPLEADQPPAEASPVAEEMQRRLIEARQEIDRLKRQLPASIRVPRNAPTITLRQGGTRESPMPLFGIPVDLREEALKRMGKEYRVAIMAGCFVFEPVTEERDVEVDAKTGVVEDVKPPPGVTAGPGVSPPPFVPRDTPPTMEEVRDAARELKEFNYQSLGRHLGFMSDDVAYSRDDPQVTKTRRLLMPHVEALVEKGILTRTGGVTGRHVRWTWNKPESNSGPQRKPRSEQEVTKAIRAVADRPEKRGRTVAKTGKKQRVSHPEVRKLIDDAKKAGAYSVRMTGGGHWEIMAKAIGPKVIISNTPSDTRGLLDDRARLRKAGLDM